MIIKKSFLFLSLFLLIFIPFSLTANILYYEATPYGIPLREISSSRVKEFEYVIVFEENGQNTIRQLLENSKEIKRWEKIDRWKGSYIETEYELDLPVCRITVNNDLIEKEEIFFEGKLSEIRNFHYVKRILTKMVVTDADEKELYTNQYLLANNGRLTRVQKEIDENPTSSYAYQYDINDLTRFTAQENEMILTYNYLGGNLTSSKQQKGEEILFYKEEYIDGIDETVEEDYKNEIKIQQFWTKSGLLYRKIRWEKNEKIIYDYKYNEDNHVIQENIRRKGAFETYLFEMDEDGNRISHKYTKNGILLRTAIYSGPTDFIETIYREDEPLFMVTYKDNIKVESLYLGDTNAKE